MILELAKMAIAASWADGVLSNDEINALKDLLFRIDDVTGEDWTILEMYMDSPTSEEEVAALLNRVILYIRNDNDKAFAIKTLEDLFCCDGEVTLEETELLEKFKDGISSASTDVISSITKAFKSAIGKRDATVQSSCLRENKMADYVMNTIYYDLEQKVGEPSVAFNRSEGEIRKLCLAAGLLSHIAYIDEVISPEEQEAMTTIIMEDWGLMKDKAELFVAISCDRATKGLDYFRLTHGFFECTNREERKYFLKTLFRIANASDNTSYEEIEAIRKIAGSLKVPHEDFIEAKLTIPRTDRNGM